MQALGLMVGDFYLLLGRPWAPRNLTLAPAEMGQKNLCYKNAFNLAQSRGYAYCEGFALPLGLIPLHHAWCVTETGEVLDPTWERKDVEYFGIALDLTFVTRFILKSQVWGVLGDRVPRELVDAPVLDFLDARWLNSVDNFSRWQELLDERGFRRTQLARRPKPEEKS
jgi:hypothetical protein